MHFRSLQWVGAKNCIRFSIRVPFDSYSANIYAIWLFVFYYLVIDHFGEVFWLCCGICVECIGRLAIVHCDTKALSCLCVL